MPGVFLLRSMVATTASAFTGSPVLNVMPSRSVSVSSVPSSLYSQLSAAVGMSSPVLFSLARRVSRIDDHTNCCCPSTSCAGSSELGPDTAAMARSFSATAPAEPEGAASGEPLQAERASAAASAAAPNAANLIGRRPVRGIDMIQTPSNEYFMQPLVTDVVARSMLGAVGQ